MNHEKDIINENNISSANDPAQAAETPDTPQTVDNSAQEPGITMPLIKAYGKTHTVHKNVQSYILELELKNRLMIESIASYFDIPSEQVERDIDDRLHDILKRSVGSPS